MKDRVVCIDVGKPAPDCTNPIKGEIYTVMQLYTGRISNGIHVKDWYVLEEFGNEFAFSPKLFRPVDDSFGSWVEETIMKEAELETVLI